MIPSCLSTSNHCDQGRWWPKYISENNLCISFFLSIFLSFFLSFFLSCSLPFSFFPSSLHSFLSFFRYSLFLYFLFSCDYASLKEFVSVSPSSHPSVRLLVTQRFLRRESLQVSNLSLTYKQRRQSSPVVLVIRLKIDQCAMRTSTTQNTTTQDKSLRPPFNPDISIF